MLRLCTVARSTSRRGGSVCQRITASSVQVGPLCAVLPLALTPRQCFPCTRGLRPDCCERGAQRRHGGQCCGRGGAGTRWVCVCVCVNVWVSLNAGDRVCADAAACRLASRGAGQAPLAANAGGLFDAAAAGVMPVSTHAAGMLCQCPIHALNLCLPATPCAAWFARLGERWLVTGGMRQPDQGFFNKKNQSWQPKRNKRSADGCFSPRVSAWVTHHVVFVKKTLEGSRCAQEA